MAAVVVITRGWATVLAFGAILLLLVIVHFLIVAKQPDAADDPAQENVKKRRRGVKALLMGADGRASTSKVQAVLWTFAVWYAFVFLLILGRSLGCDQGDLSPDQLASCNRAAEDRTTFSEVVAGELQADYYVLLGFPLGVAVASKALTSSKVSTGAVTKSPHEGADGVAQGLRETISNDRGETDLLDFQYFAFNLLTLAFFWTEFLTKPGEGLPDLPATLIGLSGLSAAAYTTRKALETDAKPGISAVVPGRVVLTEGMRLVVTGTGFGVRGTVVPDDPAALSATWVSPAAWVKVNGVSLKVEHWDATRIDTVLTGGVIDRLTGATGQPTAADLVVDVQDGAPSEPFDIELVPPA